MRQNLLYLRFHGTGPTTNSTIYEVTRQPNQPHPNIGALNVSELEFDDHNWFQNDSDELLLSFTGHFSAGPRILHYHPGSLRNYASSLLAFGSFMGKLAVIGNATLLLRSPGPALEALTVRAVTMKATKRGFDVREDWRDVVNNLNDARVYAEAGYYDIVTRKLRIRGRIHRGDGYVRD
jgi:hypothetical protein